MEQDRRYSVQMEGRIASVSEKRQKTNGKDYMYVNVVQNTGRYGKPSYFPLYLDGKILEEYEEKGFKVGDKIEFGGKLESYQKDSKQTMHIKPFEISHSKLEKQKDTEKQAQAVEI